MKIGNFDKVKTQTCPYCFKVFENIKLFSFANHVRWCKPGSRDNVYKYLGKYYIENKYGAEEYSIKFCIRCNTYYVFWGRPKTKEFKTSRFCSISCATSIGALVRNQKYGYDGFGHSEHRRVCFHHYLDKKCFLCNFDQVVHAHHLDENSKNNDPNNLFWLCPNHHALIHTTKNKEKIKKEIIVKYGAVSQLVEKQICNL